MLLIGVFTKNYLNHSFFKKKVTNKVPLKIITLCI